MSSEHHFKLLRIPRLSERRMSEILRAILCTGSTITATQIGDKQFMRLKPDWTWAEMIVKIPRKSKYENDLVYPTNVSWFEKIKGVEVLEPPGPLHINEARFADKVFEKGFEQSKEKLLEKIKDAKTIGISPEKEKEILAVIKEAQAVTKQMKEARKIKPESLFTVYGDEAKESGL